MTNPKKTQILMKIEFVGGWKYVTVCAIIGAFVGWYGVNYVMSML